MWPLLLLACQNPAPPDSPAESPAPTESAPPDSGPEQVGGGPEDDGVEEVGSPPAMFSHDRGLYTEPFELVLTRPVSEGELRYTLDGSDPTGDSALTWTGPLRIDTTTVVRVTVVLQGYPVLPTETRTYLFPADVARQTRPEGWPTEWWVEEGPYPADYEMDPEVVEDPDYAADFPAVFERLPVVSLVVDPGDLFGENGIHENPTLGGDDWERPASLEFLSPDQTAGVRCGVRIQGGAGRRPDRTPKKSFRVVFRSEYGPGRLEFPVFGEEEVSRFDTLLLRSGYNRTWAHYQHVQRVRSQYFRERYAATLQTQMGHLAPNVRPAHLFLNGLYWGIVEMEERPDAAFMAEHLGGSEDDYDAINSGVVSDGDDVAWSALLDAVRQDLSEDALYGIVLDQLEIDGFIDYMLLNFYLGNNDWPIKNWWAGRARDGGLWRFFSWDAELIQVYLSDNLLGVADPGTPGEIFQSLRANAEFRVRFGDRAHRHLFNAGALTPEAAAGTWAGLAAAVQPAVVAESARWGDHWRDVRNDGGDLYTPLDHWVPEYDRVMDEWMPYRRDVLIEQLREAELYPAIDAPALSPFGGGAPAELSLSGDGALYYTLDGSDPRQAGGALSPAALEYTGPVALDGAATVSARARVDGAWSALVVAEFSGP